LQVFANLRPVKVHPALIDASPLKPEKLQGVDIIVVRELTGGLYFGAKKREVIDGHDTAIDTLEYHDYEVQRVVELAFQLAATRRKKVTSVDKANVLEVTELWRKVVTRIHKDEGYAGVQLEHMLVDNCAMQLIRNPKQFDVVVTTNMFGDILSDEAAMLTGSIGMLPSASLGGKVGMYEPVHGSAPDITAQDKANPLATILSVAMMLRHSLDQGAAAERIEKAVQEVLDAGYRTADIQEMGCKLVGCRQMGRLVRDKIENAKG
jgi:3-isopropylmalate dehydrogenase